MLRLLCRVCVQRQLHHDDVHLFRGVLQPINEFEQLHGVNWHVYAVWRWTRVRRRRRATHALHMCCWVFCSCWRYNKLRWVGGIVSSLLCGEFMRGRQCSASWMHLFRGIFEHIDDIFCLCWHRGHMRSVFGWVLLYWWCSTIDGVLSSGSLRRHYPNAREYMGARFPRVGKLYCICWGNSRGVCPRCGRWWWRRLE